MPFSVRLDAEAEAKIRRLSAETGRSRSAVVREAVAQYDPDDEPAHRPSEPSTFDRLKAVAGVVRTGGANYSQDTHAKYRARLSQKRRGRRTR